MLQVTSPVELERADLFTLARGCQPRHILVTGATGFVGGHYLHWRSLGAGRFFAVVRGRTAEDGRVRLAAAMERYAASYGLPFDRRRWEERVTALRGDITREALGLSSEDQGLLQQVGIDEVWHFASSLRFAEREREEVEAHNLGGSRHALELAKALGASRFVYISTAFSSGNVQGLVPEALHNPSNQFMNLYEETKCRAEHQVMEFCQANGMAVSILRPSIVLGPVMTHRSGGSTTGLYAMLSLMYRLRRTLSGSQNIVLQGDPNLPLNAVSIDQVVRDMLYLERRGFAGGPIYHMTAPVALTQQELVDAVAEPLQVPPFKVVRDRGRAPSPSEEVIEQYVASYGANHLNERHFVRSLPTHAGITRDDFDAYVRFYFQELQKGDGRALFRRDVLTTADGVELCSYTAGKPGARPVVLLNAYGMPVDFWTPMASALARDHFVVTWESRYVPTLIENFDPDRCDVPFHVDDLKTLLQHHSLDKVDLVAWCSGAQVALAFAARYAERVGSLVLLNGTYLGGESLPRTAFQRSFISLVRQISGDRRRARMYYEMIYGKGANRFSQQGPERQQLQQLFTGVDPLLLHMTSAPFRDPEALYRYANLFARFFSHSDMLEAGPVTVPTLIVTTPTDVISHPDASVLAAECIQTARLLRLEAGDHYSMYHDRELPGLVREFLVESSTMWH
jgi:nucleoside-diphosphate-sugar epimerase/pimeloyl-ACP methyl ester carboxylesterase